MRLAISYDRQQIEGFCQRNHVLRLSFFGSVLRDDFSADSDVDVLVEFAPGHVPGLAFFDLEADLCRILGRRVDLHTPASLSVYFRDDVLRHATPEYVSP